MVSYKVLPPPQNALQVKICDKKLTRSRKIGSPIFFCKFNKEQARRQELIVREEIEVLLLALRRLGIKGKNLREKNSQK